MVSCGGAVVSGIVSNVRFVLRRLNHGNYLLASIKRVFILLDPLHEPRSRQGLPLSWGGELNGLALCAGFGGLEGGLERTLPEYRTVCYVEGEAYPAAVLAQKMEKGTVRKAPIWSNVITFDGKPWRGKVDIISGGFPCQPHSQAGKLLGKDDPRNLWPQIVRIAGEIRPRFMFLENVANINNTYGKEIVGDLAQMGFDAAWCVVRASDVGAPHRRARWFLLASNSDNSHELIKSIYGSLKGPSEFEEVVYDTHSERVGFSTQQPKTPTRQLDFKGSCQDVADSLRERPRQDGESFFGEIDSNGGEVFEGRSSQNLGDSISQGSKGGLQNGIIDIQKRDRQEQIFINKPSEGWRGGVEFWKVEPRVGRMVDGVANWSHRIRGCGNGVVPQQAAYAFQILAGRLACGIDANREPRG